MNIDCYAAQGAKAPLETFSYASPTLAPWDVEVKISHCGICHSDVHLVDNDWGISQYPLVPGHEIVGTVSAMGASVSATSATATAALIRTTPLVIVEIGRAIFNA